MARGREMSGQHERHDAERRLVCEQQWLDRLPGRHEPRNRRVRDHGTREQRRRPQRCTSICSSTPARRHPVEPNDGHETNRQADRRDLVAPDWSDRRGDVSDDDRDQVNPRTATPAHERNEGVHERTPMDVQERVVEVAEEPRQSGRRQQRAGAGAARPDQRPRRRRTSDRRQDPVPNVADRSSRTQLARQRRRARSRAERGAARQSARGHARRRVSSAPERSRFDMNPRAAAFARRAP